MAISNTTALAGPFTPNGVTTAFPYTFAALSASEVSVVRQSAAGVQTTITGWTTTYGVTGGTVTFTTAPAAGDPIYILSSPNFAQQVNFENQGAFLPATINEALDRGAVRDIYLKDGVSKNAAALIVETAARTTADATEVAARISADTAETAARISADATEVAARISGDATEATARTSADTTLTTAITTEVAARIAAIAAIGPGIPGINGGIGSSAGNAALFVAAPGMAIGTGITSFFTTGYSSVGWGAGNYIYDSAVNSAFVATYPAVSFLAADGRGFRLDLTQTLTAGMFGIVGDGVTDITAQFTAMQTYLRAYAPPHNSGLFKSGPRVYFPLPPKHYYTATGLNLNLVMEIIGSGSGAPNVNACLIRAGVNCNVLTVNDYRTLGRTTGSIGDAGGSLVQGFCLYGGNVSASGGTITTYGSGLSSIGHGLSVRGTGVRISDISSYFNAEDGIYIHADSGGVASENGNANNWRSEDTWCFYNDGSGFHVYGNDANSGTAVNVNCIQNRIAGIFDQSFLGNTWIQPHTRDNGLYSSTGLNLPTGMCTYGGVSYSASWFGAASASTVVPGTDNTVWIPIANVNGGAKAWVSGMTWAVGAPYLVTNVNARSLFLNPYGESGQGACQSAGSSLFLQGLLAVGSTEPVVSTNGGVANFGFVRFGSQALATSAFSATSTGSYIGGDASFGITGSTWTHKLTAAAPNGKLSWASNSSGSGGYVYTIDNYSDPYSMCFTANRLRVAPFNSFNSANGGFGLNFINSPTQIGATDYLLNGDIFYRSGGAAGDSLGWYVTGASGPAGATPATKLTRFGCIGYIGYTLGDGGAVTQATSKATGVTLNKATGQITLNASSVAANSVVNFTFTNSTIAATDCMRINSAGGIGTPGSYIVQAESIANGSCTVTVRNMTAGALAEALVLNFVLIKGVSA